MNPYLIEPNYALNVSDIQLLDRHFGTEIYVITADCGKYVVKVLPLYFEHADNEGPITELLLGRGLQVARLLKNKNGDYVTKTPDFQFTVQEHIGGEILHMNSAPKWFMEKSAEFLGKTILCLQDYRPLPLRFGKEFFSPSAVIERKQQYVAKLAQAKATADVNAISAWENQIRHLDRISDFHIDTDQLTYANSHGDYHIGQAIVRDNDITVIDWTSACRLPICFEVGTSYVFASPTCSRGAVDVDGLNRYIRDFAKYFPLTAYDVKAMPYVLYFWHCMCNYRPDEYADIAESYRPIARLTNRLLDWFYENVEVLSNALIA